MKSLLILPFLIIKALSGSIYDNINPLLMRDSCLKITKSCFVDKSQYKMLDPNLVESKLIYMAQDTYAKLKSAGIDTDKSLSELDPNTLAVALKNTKYFNIEYDTNKLCGLKVYKNATSGSFIVEYKSFFTSECLANSANKIICNNSENNRCDMAIKCCDPSTMCEVNAFFLKSVATSDLQAIKNNNGDACTYNQNNGTSCFTLAP